MQQVGKKVVLGATTIAPLPPPLPIGPSLHEEGEEGGGESGVPLLFLLLLLSPAWGEGGREEKSFNVGEFSEGRR